MDTDLERTNSSSRSEWMLDTSFPAPTYNPYQPDPTLPTIPPVSAPQSCQRGCCPAKVLEPAMVQPPQSKARKKKTQMAGVSQFFRHESPVKFSWIRYAWRCLLHFWTAPSKKRNEKLYEWLQNGLLMTLAMMSESDWTWKQPVVQFIPGEVLQLGIPKMRSSFKRKMSCSSQPQPTWPNGTLAINLPIYQPTQQSRSICWLISINFTGNQGNTVKMKGLDREYGPSLKLTAKAPENRPPQ